MKKILFAFFVASRLMAACHVFHDAELEDDEDRSCPAIVLPPLGEEDDDEDKWQMPSYPTEEFDPYFNPFDAQEGVTAERTFSPRSYLKVVRRSHFS